MKRYYFELTDRSYNDLGAFIPDGYSKEVAVRQAKRWMAENRIVLATLIVNSLRTSNVLEYNVDYMKDGQVWTVICVPEDAIQELR